MAFALADSEVDDALAHGGGRVAFLVLAASAHAPIDSLQKQERSRQDHEGAYKTSLHQPQAQKLQGHPDWPLHQAAHVWQRKGQKECHARTR